MIRHAFSIVLPASALFLTGCSGSAPADSAQSPSLSSSAAAAAAARDHGYALLYATLKDESDVDKVLIIKRPAPQVADLVKAIGQFSRDSRSTLELLAKEDPAIALDNQDLPQMETKTREAISSATAKQILLSGGKELEFRLLLTQHEALNYITHLAATLAEQDARDNRKRYLAHLVKESTALHGRVIAQLQTPYVGQPK